MARSPILLPYTYVTELRLIDSQYLSFKSIAWN